MRLPWRPDTRLALIPRLHDKTWLGLSLPMVTLLWRPPFSVHGLSHCLLSTAFSQLSAPGVYFKLGMVPPCQGTRPLFESAVYFGLPFFKKRITFRFSWQPCILPLNLKFVIQEINAYGSYLQFPLWYPAFNREDTVPQTICWVQSRVIKGQFSAKFHVLRHKAKARNNKYICGSICRACTYSQR